MGEARRWLRETLPDPFRGDRRRRGRRGALVAVAIAIGRIREHRPARYALIAAALVLAVVYSARSSIGNPESDVVEHVHFIEYGIVTWLFYRAWLGAWRWRGDRAAAAGRPGGGDVRGVVPVVPPGAGRRAARHLPEWRGDRVRAAVQRRRSCRPAIRPSARAAAAVAGRTCWRAARCSRRCLPAFLNCVHLGYEIVDPEAGTFRSIYTRRRARRAGARSRQALGSRSAARAAGAAVARGSVHERGAAARAGAQPAVGCRRRATAAWFENRILEKYFAPVLDTPSYVSRTGHRWPPAQRARRRAARGTDRRRGVPQRAQGTFRSSPGPGRRSCAGPASPGPGAGAACRAALRPRRSIRT